jgi:YD repeat-containing protein
VPTDNLVRSENFGLRFNNRRIGVKDALNGQSSYSYDKVGNLTLVKDANNRATNYGYDALNRQTTITNALGQSTNTTYDLVM